MKYLDIFEQKMLECIVALQAWAHREIGSGSRIGSDPFIFLCEKSKQVSRRPPLPSATLVLEMEKGVRRWVVDISEWDPPPDHFSSIVSLLPLHDRSAITRLGFSSSSPPVLYIDMDFFFLSIDFKVLYCLLAHRFHVMWGPHGCIRNRNRWSCGPLKLWDSLDMAIFAWSIHLGWQNSDEWAVG